VGAHVMIMPNPTATAITLATRRRNEPITFIPFWVGTGRYDTRVLGSTPRNPTLMNRIQTQGVQFKLYNWQLVAWHVLRKTR
jgi:hypothetical protein